jgi:GR25 family glycosyltransferase involved in LPS biosynthesis
MDKRLRFFINKILNYSIVEISLTDRLKFFFNHVRHIIGAKRKLAKRMRLAIEKIFIISLELRDDRRAHIRFQLSKIPFEYSFVNGVLWSQASDSTKKLFTKRSMKNLTFGSLGCAAAHLNALQKVSVEEKNGLYLILEDDIILSETFMDQIKHVQENYPVDADIFYLGGKNVRKRDISYFIDDYIFKCFNPRIGMYAYLITPATAKRIISFIIPYDLVYGGIDTKIGKLVRRNKIIAYQIYPPTITVDFSLSSNIYNPSEKNKILHPSTIKE